jgi:glucose/arabinose dehydrogenase
MRTRSLAIILTVFTVLAVAAPAVAKDPDTVGLMDPATGQWHLRNEAGGIATFFYGDPGDVPFVGDWDCDGTATPGLFRTSDAFVYLRNSNTQGVADVRFFFGNPSDVPLAGDFNGDGCDTLSIYRPSEQRFYIVNELGEDEGGLGAADFSFLFGNPGDKPVVGDWDGDGIDEVGLHRESSGFFYWRDTLDTGVADGEIFFGDPADRFVAGDWGVIDGEDTPGLFRPSDVTFYFRHTLTQGTADSQFTWTGAGPNWLPIAGAFGEIAAIPPLELESVATGLSQPLFVTDAPGDPRLFVVEKGGRVKILENGTPRGTPFLTASVSSGSEQGLLGLAFHPAYASNGRLFVNYTDGDGNTQVDEYAADPGGNTASRVGTIISVVQPAGNHNGGMLAFGPDGYLHIGMGDGGGSNDQFGNGQKPSTLLGSMLRLDVDGGTPYAAVPGNYDGTSGASEVWASGLRNPWRFSFDRLTGDLYIGDVGQNTWEEIDVVASDVVRPNFGWNTMEGFHCFSPSSGCNMTGLTLPVVEYDHGVGNSITGGYVYRGTAIDGLQGTYFYGDFGSGVIRSFRSEGGKATDQRDWTSTLGPVVALASFGEDADGELYLVSLAGTVYKLVAAG